MGGWSFNAPHDGGLPHIVAGSAPASCLFEACSAFTQVTACLLAESPTRPFFTEGFGDFVTSIAAPIATGWNDSCRAGITPAEEARLFTAHYNAGMRRKSFTLLASGIIVFAGTFILMPSPASCLLIVGIAPFWSVWPYWYVGLIAGIVLAICGAAAALAD